jgi:hypothetical protein
VLIDARVKMIRVGKGKVEDEQKKLGAKLSSALVRLCGGKSGNTRWLRTQHLAESTLQVVSDTKAQNT